MKLAFIAYLHGNGGAERQIIMLANEMAKRHNDVSLIVLAEYKPRYEISSMIKVFDLTRSKCTNFWRILNRYKALKKTLKIIQPDITINFWLQSTYLVALMNKRIRGRIIYSERGDPGDEEYKGLLGLVRRQTFKRVDGFVFQTRQARDYFDKRVIARSEIIHNCIDSKVENYIKPCINRKKRIINVGRLHRQKNQHLLIKAFSLISSQIPDYTLEIFGEGELENQLKKTALDLGIEKRVFFRGVTNDIYKELHCSSVFVLSSEFEGMPNVLIEAMSLGVPSISTNYKPGGVNEIIEDGYNGFICERNDEKALASKILFVINNPDKASEISKHSIEARLKYSRQPVFDKWDHFLQKYE